MTFWREQAPGTSLSQLHGSLFRSSTADAAIVYALSARAVRRIIQLRGVSAIVALLHDLARAAPFAAAFHHRVGMRYEDCQALVAR